MRNLSIWIIIIIINVSIGNAQDNPLCAPTGPGEIIDYGGNRSSTTLTEVRLNIFIHIVRKSDGTEGLTESQVDMGISAMEADFLQHDIYFIEVGREYIDNTAYYYLSSGNSTLRCEIFSNYSNNDMIDIYFIAPNGDDYGVAESIPGKSFIVSGTRDGIVLGTSSVLSHEMGHCLGLYHTFRGSNKGTTPTPITWTNPCTNQSYTTNICRELVSGTNSLICGDFIETTEADFGMSSFHVDNNCNYTGSEQEQGTGSYYEPDPDNIMSYTRTNCLERFTGEQGSTMLSTVENSTLLNPVIDSEIILANREFDSGNDLGGYLFLDDLSTVGLIDHENVFSGTDVPFIYDHFHDVGTEQDIINTKKHINWGWNRNKYLLVQENIPIPNKNEISAIFEDKIQVTFQSLIQFEIYDPWYVSDPSTLTQPDAYQFTLGGTFNMFEEQGGFDVQNLEFPYYTVRAPGNYIIEGNDRYYFQGWRVEPENAAVFEDETALETSIVFQGGNCTIILDYINLNALEGNIRVDLTLNGTINVVGDVTIQSSANITFSPGTIVNVNPYKWIFVEGSLTANGVDFTRSDPNNTSRTYWSGIFGRPGSTVLLNNCSVEGAVFGLKGNIANVRANYSTFIRNHIGMYLSHCTTYYSHDNQFTDNICGIYLYSSHVPIHNNTISNNERIGLFSVNSSGDITNNIITNNGISGIHANYHSTIALTDIDYGGAEPVNNIITNNGGYGVNIGYNSTPDLGTYFADSKGWTHGGYNTFHSSANGLDINSYNTSRIYAQMNWWETQEIIGNVWTIPEAGDEPMPRSLSPDFPVDSLLLAVSLTADSLYAAALIVYRQLLNDYPNRQEAEMVMGKIMDTHRTASQSNDDYSDITLITELESIYTNLNTSLAGLSAYDHSIAIQGMNGHIIDAIVRCDEMIDIYENTDTTYTENIAYVMYEQGQLLESLPDSLTGQGKLLALPTPEEIYQRILDNYPNTQAAELVRMGRIESEDNFENDLIPESFTLYPAYPNPFNPSTTIKYDLPQDSEINLTVYNIMGQEVKKLTDGVKPAGVNTIRWNGTNRHNETVSSGMYLVRLTTPKSVLTQKIVLMK